MTHFSPTARLAARNPKSCPVKRPMLYVCSRERGFLHFQATLCESSKRRIFCSFLARCALTHAEDKAKDHDLFSLFEEQIPVWHVLMKDTHRKAKEPRLETKTVFDGVKVW